MAYDDAEYFLYRLKAYGINGLQGVVRKTVKDDLQVMHIIYIMMWLK